MLRRPVAAGLELRAYVGDGEAQAADRAEQLAVAVVARLDGGVHAFRLEVHELPSEDRRDPGIVVDRRDIARELDGGVVTRRDAVLILVPVPGDEGVRAEDREERARALGDRLPGRVRLREMKVHGAVAVVEKVCWDD